MSNKCGEWKSPMPWPMDFQDSKFQGNTAIVDSNGSIKNQFDDKTEDVIISEVNLNKEIKNKNPP